jgi:hypothetical protein
MAGGLSFALLSLSSSIEIAFGTRKAQLPELVRIGETISVGT